MTNKVKTEEVKGNYLKGKKVKEQLGKGERRGKSKDRERKEATREESIKSCFFTASARDAAVVRNSRGQVAS